MSGKYDHMNLDEVKKYFLQHRDDQEAFYAYMDKLNDSGRAIVIDPTDPESERIAFAQIELHAELMERCRSVMLESKEITACGQASSEDPKPWKIDIKGKPMYFTAQEMKQYLESLSSRKAN
ncbi:MAG: DUF6887 family protein [Chroococcidiopsis sp.]